MVFVETKPSAPIHSGMPLWSLVAWVPRPDRTEWAKAHEYGRDEDPAGIGEKHQSTNRASRRWEVSSRRRVPERIRR